MSAHAKKLQGGPSPCFLKQLARSLPALLFLLDLQTLTVTNRLQSLDNGGARCRHGKECVSFFLKGTGVSQVIRTAGRLPAAVFKMCSKPCSKLMGTGRTGQTGLVGISKSQMF